MALVSVSDLEKRLSRSLTSDETSDFSVINAAIQAYVENLIGSSVEAVAESTRYFDGGVQFLKINPCTDITKIEYVDNYYVSVEDIETQDYIKDPLDKTLTTMIKHRYGKFYNGMNNVAVTAKFSINASTETLAIVKDAIISAIASEIDNSDEIIKESIEGYSVEMARPESKQALDSIKYLFPGIM